MPGTDSALQESIERLHLDEQGYLAQPLSCLGCGYDLRGLDPAGRCPECDTPITASAHSGLMRFSDSIWCHRLKVSLNWLIVGVFLGGCSANLRHDPGMISIVMLLMKYGVTIAALVVLTTPEPNREGFSAVHAEYDRWRRLYRFWGISSQLVGISARLMTLSSSQTLYAGVEITLLLITVVEVWAMGGFVEILARRLGSSGIERSVRLARILGMILFGALAVLLAAALATWLVGSPSTLGGSGGALTVTVGGQAVNASSVLAIPTVVLSLGAVGVSLWGFVLMFMFHSRLSATLEFSG